MPRFKIPFYILTFIIMFCLAGLVVSGAIFAESPQNLCLDNEDGTVTDNATGLMWQKATAGPMNWYDAMSYASGLSLGGPSRRRSGWTLPTKDDLLRLYNLPCKNMMDVRNALDDAFYWSSSQAGNNGNDAWGSELRRWF